MRPLAALAALSLLALPATVAAQPRPDPAREALRESLLSQAREARRREDWGACTSYLDAATAIRADTLVRYGSALCAFEAGLFPEARRFAVACLGETVGDASLHDQCRAVLVQLDALEREPATPAPRAASPRPAEPPSVASAPRTAPTPHPATEAPRRGVPVGAIALWAVGGASLVASAVGFGAWSASTSGCAVTGDRAVCPTRADADRAADAGTWATATNTTFAVGLAAVAGGVTWWLVDRARGAPADARAPHVVAGVGPGSAAVTVTF